MFAKTHAKTVKQALASGDISRHRDHHGNTVYCVGIWLADSTREWYRTGTEALGAWEALGRAEAEREAASHAREAEEALADSSRFVAEKLGDVVRYRLPGDDWAEMPLWKFRSQIFDLEDRFDTSVFWI